MGLGFCVLRCCSVFWFGAHLNVSASGCGGLRLDFGVVGFRHASIVEP